MGSDQDAQEHGEAESERLVRHALSGDAASFARLYERIAPAVLAWAELRIRPAMRARLEPVDLVQEVWCRAWRGMERFDPRRTSFRFWVFRIAKNVLLEAFRQLRRPGGAGEPGPTTRVFLLQNLPDSATAVSRRLAREESLQEFATMVRALSEDDQKLVVHCGLEGLAYREVGERMGLTDEAVAKRWQRLRARLVERGVQARLLARDGG